MTRTALIVCAAALSLLGWAVSAQASTAHRDAVLASTDEWISSVLRVPVPDRADLPGGAGELEAGGAEVACWDSGTARYDPMLLRAMADRRDLYFQGAWETALHEHLHLRGGPCVYVLKGERWVIDPAWRYLEEGLADAVRVDLFPAFFSAHFGRGPDWSSEPMDRYARNVAVVRALSRFGSGSSSWRDRDARLWRRRALLADWPTRQALIAAANAARVAA